MARSTTLVTPEPQNFGERVKAWPDRTRNFLQDVRTEMKKVTSPSFKEVRATTAVVIITVFLFALYFFVIDHAIGWAVDRIFSSAKGI